MSSIANIVSLFPNGLPAPDQQHEPAVSTQQPTQDNKVVLHDGELVIYKRDGLKDPKWQYRLVMPDGSYERRTTGTKDLSTATKIAEDRYQEVRWRQQQGLSQHSYTFAEAAKAYVQSLKAAIQADPKAKHSLRRTKIAAVEKFMLPHFGDTLPLNKVDTAAVTAFHQAHLAEWERKQATAKTKFVRRPGAVARRLHEDIIKGIQELAVRQRQITAAETHVIDRTVAKDTRRGWFNEQELSTLRAELLRYENENVELQPTYRAKRQRLRLWVEFMLLTGLRPGVEVDGVRFQDVQLMPATAAAPEHCVLHVRTGKTGPRRVVVSVDVMGVLNALTQLHPDPKPDACVWHTDGKIEVGFRKVLTQAGLQLDDQGHTRTAYSLRHTYATHRLNSHVSLDLLARNMGTSVIMIQRHYSHIIHTQHAAALLK